MRFAVIALIVRMKTTRTALAKACIHVAATDVLALAQATALAAMSHIIKNVKWLRPAAQNTNMKMEVLAMLALKTRLEL